MNVEIGSTLINGFALNKALSTMYNDLRDRIEINDVASKYVFADISDIIPEFNVMKTYPIDCFKTFINTPEVNIKNITIVQAIPYDIQKCGIITLIDVKTMNLIGLGLVKSVNISGAEILFLKYISDTRQILSEEAGNLITLDENNKIYLSNELVEITSNKIYKIDENSKIIKVYETYLDYNASDIKKMENIYDGAFIVIIKDPLHDNKPWLYELKNTNSVSPTIVPVKEYKEIKNYASELAVKSYVDSSIVKTNKEFDNDTIVKNNKTKLWEVAIDRHTINKNKNGLYQVDLDVLKQELLNVESKEGNVVIFNDSGYIKDDGWGITSDEESIDNSKKLVSKGFLNNQCINQVETNDLIYESKINN